MSESKKYKERLGKMVKDMSASEKREYARLRKKDSRAGNTRGKAKPAKKKSDIRTFMGKKKPKAKAKAKPGKKKLNCAVMTKGGKTFTVCNKVGQKKPGNKYAGGKGANKPSCKTGKARRNKDGTTSGCGYNPKLKKYGDRGDGKKVLRKARAKKTKAKPKKKSDINTFYKKK